MPHSSAAIWHCFIHDLSSTGGLKRLYHDAWYSSYLYNVWPNQFAMIILFKYIIFCKWIGFLLCCKISKSSLIKKANINEYCPELHGTKPYCSIIFGACLLITEQFETMIMWEFQGIHAILGYFLLEFHQFTFQGKHMYYSSGLYFDTKRAPR